MLLRTLVKICSDFQDSFLLFGPDIYTAGKHAIMGNTEIPEDSELVTGDVFFVNSFQELLVQILQISNNNNNHLNT